MKFFERNQSQTATLPLEQSVETDVPIVVSAKTGLASKDNAILRRIPIEYQGKSVKEVFDYLFEAGLNDNELLLVESIKKELSAAGSVIMVNGKTAQLDDNASKYLVERAHKLPNGQTKKYRELEIEVSAVQQGGYN